MSINNIFIEFLNRIYLVQEEHIKLTPIVTIEFIENPGWLVRVNNSNKLQNRTILKQYGVDKCLWPINKKWLVCRVDQNNFEGAGDLLRLEEILFFYLVVECQKSLKHLDYNNFKMKTNSVIIKLCNWLSEEYLSNCLWQENFNIGANIFLQFVEENHYRVQISLMKTKYENSEFSEVSHNYDKNDLNRGKSWYRCFKEGYIFTGCGSIDQIEKIIEIFLEYINQ